MTNNLNGVLTALVTPFDQDEAIDLPVLKKVVDRSVESGVDGVVAAGSTAEVGALSPDERLRLVDTVVEHTAGRVPVVAQTGATSTAEAIRLSRAAERSGADVLMLVTPFYEPITLDETVAYLEDVAASVELPIMLYNIPAATGVNLDPETVRGLAESTGNIRYIKDSSANWEQALQLIHHHRDVIGTFIGWDVYIYSALVEGAAGVMAGAANVVPEEIVAVSRSIAEGDLSGALARWKALYPVIDSLISAPFIPAVKAGVALRGLDVGSPRRPTSPLDEVSTARVEEALAAIREEAR
ncbi:MULTISPECIES: 4-hydroxy-tetrahydrodipicolinate synthase [unclassified Saccharopolyspora]|uniref:4-hydroxy-tetrahydrodipicolinate synthase n=1 Tax=unclassified Saccharopolyspora TaxID=2646250 RepID=UPI001CD6C665|nr:MULTISPECIES: 4-hydroxy-tetrahydrodipicolinate synthase [unclassified Saccharopolyspora]MCA1184992.1 4-hydroxy-tetrahydrodipicolinate synthase [Saccharopolyspora sp. 6T]MCA1190714.1 4-hydroxy-tetrahydrodipicolinate synthase [Saccharopolyspora sp. 6V]MCA1225496.1 4-hydroxy-tetrahydrodipicolinate synthase [Saccharopolyspora sp. 6M]MCA1278178.1 4-hydroxy-tetrahydrodipicolinate synthase [Saccharopolyspora sp. 7B]